MKRILFCAAIAAFATACTNEDDLVLNQENSRTQGLTFDVALAEGATTRGELTEDNGTYPFFWYAETDLINVYAANVNEAKATNKVGASNIVVAAGATQGDWELAVDGTSDNIPAKYKATQSAGTGQFTAQNTTDLLTLKNFDSATPKADITAQIIATYGDLDVETATSVMKDDKPVAGELKELTLKTTGTAISAQALTRANEVKAPMYSVSSAKKDEAYHSLGERANLKLIRPFPLLKFTTKNTADYIKEFGKLKSVELEALGDKDGSNVSKLAFDTGKKFTVKGATPGFESGYAVSTTPEKVKVTYNGSTGVDWTDNDAVYMTVAPVSRDLFSSTNKELLKVTYEFEKITFTLDPSDANAKDFEKELQTSSNWTALTKEGQPNGVISIPALDINNYKYLVTGSSATRTLIVLSGNLKDALNDAKTAIVWGNATVGCDQFTKIISNVNLSDDDLALIKKFTALKDLTLKENVSLSANTFSTTQAGAITNLDLPKVTTIADKFINNSVAGKFAALVEYSLPEYAFGSAAVANAFFNEEVKATLTKADISGVVSMKNDFAVRAALAFTGYAALTEVTVKDGVIVSQKAFEGCEVLKTINGTLDITGASDAFKMTDNDQLTSVEITGTEIPANAFVNCSTLATILHNDVAIAPTAIGKNAFEGTAALQYLDLSKAATIGEAAFKGSGIKASRKKTAGEEEEVLIVGAKVLNASIFENCNAIEFVEFTNATEIAGNNIFNTTGTPKLVHIKFKEVFTVKDATAATAYDNLFKDITTVANIQLYVNALQTGVEGNVLTLSFNIPDGSKIKVVEKEYIFKTIDE